MISLIHNVHAQSPPIYDTLSIGNIKQVVSYSGSKDAPVILFLHGGPGSSRMKQAEVFSNILQNILWSFNGISEVRGELRH
ncbi:MULTISPECIES: hypothetical protein [unclassified Sphingobacterium]|uniref:hypothetical protein n=1 Tax=unclassified Sphingobacterium TaxID=2609468 RepID=UPI0025F8B8FE|nr:MULTISPECIES: hypothetical protein [unclassified Sphingobacterium]